MFQKSILLAETISDSDRESFRKVWHFLEDATGHISKNHI
nr:MAG TPA: hypothetical protein [Caudoviricetes sp.]